MNKKRVEFGGHVHLMSVLQVGEYSLCGVAFDAADTENDESLRFRPTKKRTVDCPQCVLEIENCRYVQTTTTGVSSC